MATTTTNNGWDIPQSSDLVKDGATIIAALGQDIDTSVGTGLLAWTAYTPTFTNFTVSSSTVYYALLGKQVRVRGKLVLNAAPTGALTMSTPAGASFRNSAWAVGEHIGNATIIDASPLTTYPACVTYQTTTTVRFAAFNAAATYLAYAAATATVPITFANTDEIYFDFSYEAA